MNFEVFQKSLLNNDPPEVKDECKALWFEAKGNWDKAHKIVQELSSKEAAWVHAYLHRKEGDEGNAGYWYRMAGKPFPNISPDDEWRDILLTLLDV